MPLQLTPAGLEISSLDEIVEQINARIRASPDLGPDMRLEAGGVLSDLVAVFAKRDRLLQEALSDLFNAFSRSTAEGANLDNVGDILAVPRPLATRSTVLQTINGTPATSIPQLSRVRVPSGSIFRTTIAVVIPGGGTIDVIVESEETGEIEGGAGTITEIVDGLAGWTSTTNVLDATRGRLTFTDPAYRGHIANSLQTGETATDQAIRTAVEKVANVLSVLVSSNRTLVTSTDGTTAKSFRTVVWPATVDTEAVAMAIWDTMPGGIKPYGVDVTHIFTDDQGYVQSVSFDFASELDIWLIINVVVDPLLFPIDGEDQIKAFVDLLDAAATPNRDFLPLELECLIVLVDGIRECEVLAGVAPAPTLNDPIVTAIDELFALDSVARTTVNVT